MPWERSRGQGEETDDRAGLLRWPELTGCGLEGTAQRGPAICEGGLCPAIAHKVEPRRAAEEL